MFFKVIDKFFDEIKQVISFIIFILIALALLMILYWFFYIIKLSLPEWLNDFVWGVMNVFTPLFSSFRIENLTDIMPVLTAVILSMMIYALNLFMVLLEDLHIKAKNTRDMCRNKLERTINSQLKQSFVKELNKNSYMLVKIKVHAEKEVSHLSGDDIKNLDTEALAKEIVYEIWSNVNSDLVKNKGKTDNTVYFLLSNFDKSRKFFTELVATSSQVMGKYVRPFLKMSFTCAADMYENISAFEEVNNKLEQMVDLRVSNKIVVSSAVHVYYTTLHPEMYYFKMLGEYVIKDLSGKGRTVTLYNMMRR